MHFGKEAFDNGNIIVQYKGTDKMKADGLSKPFDHGEHRHFAKLVSG
jgi:hypothetical protein